MSDSWRKKGRWNRMFGAKQILIVYELPAVTFAQLNLSIISLQLIIWI